MISRLNVSIAFLLQLTAASAFAQNRVTDTVKWKLLFNQLFALEIKKESSDEESYQNSLKTFSSYSSNSFNQTVADVLKADTSEDAYLRRLAIYSNDANFRDVQALDFSRTVPQELRNNPEIAAYLKVIESNRTRSINPSDNFFDSTEAANVIKAISFAKGGATQQVAFVMVAGYAGHTTKFEIFPEIVEDMNKHWGRPPFRPFTEPVPGDTRFQPANEFYNQGANGRPFDILHPVGLELGNTVGPSEESSEHLAKWIKDLPAEYANKKLILLGYSKGAPVILQMLKDHPELKPRLLGVVTYAGVVQGTHIGRWGRELLRKLLGNESTVDFINKLRLQGLDDSSQALASFFSVLDTRFQNLPSILQTLRIAGVDIKHLESQVNRVLAQKEVTQFIDGVSSMAPDTRTAWNIQYFDNNLVAPNTFFFNLSAVTDVSTWASRPAFNNVEIRKQSLLTPVLNGDNSVDWKNFSLDAWFLYLSSIKGFRMAPGGLYDTQVELAHTKTPWLDSTPLTSSLTKEEIEAIWNKSELRSKLNANGIASLDMLMGSPRNQLIRSENRSNVCAYDLGEIKGHHWSNFRQALLVPEQISKVGASWEFPRKAYMRALLQTIGLYNLIVQSSN